MLDCHSLASAKTCTIDSQFTETPKIVNYGYVMSSWSWLGKPETLTHMDFGIRIIQISPLFKSCDHYESSEVTHPTLFISQFSPQMKDNPEYFSLEHN